MAGGLNVYGFASGDPVDFSDPFGLCIEDACIGEIALATTIIEEAPAIEEEAPVIAEDVSAAVSNAAEKGGSLVQNLKNSGEVRQAGEAAHHIVAKAAKAAAPARDALKRVGIKINDALNGVNLPATKGYVGRAVNHLYVHTKAYYEAVNQLLTNVKTREDAVQVLDMIKQSLLDGSFSH